ncbi:MAG: molybdate ABC transporter substrate-binding protein [Smithella sp.]|nr:molybdate ABC transporter substrate-binding protein [Smithella sp.]
MKKIVSAVLILLCFFMMPRDAVSADKISVAVAANFISAFKEIARDFEARTGAKVEATFSSTGRFYAQIKNGAPYDIFLSADEERPDLLQKEGWTEGVFIYARGQAILWSADKNFCKDTVWSDALKYEKIKKISMANPQTAPYGASAKAALETAGLWDTLQKKLVFAETIAQSFQYASTGAVDAGFCALSATVNPRANDGCFYHLPEAPDIVQAGCVNKNAKNKKCAELFAAYLLSDHAAQIKRKYGYR